VQRIKSSNLNRGLVGAWCPSVAGNGLLLPDLSGYGNHGTLTNMDASDWVGTDKGRALDFDGVDDYVQLQKTQTIDNLKNKDKSIYAWIKTSTPGASYRTVISVDRNFALTLKDSVFITYDWAVSSDRSSGRNVADGVWHLLHVNIKSGVASGSQLLVDGIVEATITYGNQLGSVTPIMTIGTASDGLGFVVSEYVNMQIGEIGIFNRQLSIGECRTLYEGGPGFGLRVERKRSRFAITVKPKRGARSPRKVDKGNLKQGLVGAWCPSVAGNGLLLPDLSGRGNHGTLTNMNASDWVGTDRGRALDFDGSNDHIALARSVTFTSDTGYGFSFWLNKTALSSAGNGGLFRDGNQFIVVNDGGGTGTGRVWGRHNGVEFADGPDGPLLLNAGWSHIGLTWDKATVRFYFNGRQWSTLASTALTTFSVSVLGGQGPFTEFFLGQMDDIRLYNRALSPSEIKQLYEGGPGFGLRQERKRSRFQVQGFNVGRYRRQQLIGTGVY
jgi:hypothetical protein